MNIKTKKQNADGMVRLETSGIVKEIIFKEDFLKPKDASIQICFKGQSSSGIVELSPEELERIYKDTFSKINILKETKVMKFNK
jgi:hypothetical protein